MLVLFFLFHLRDVLCSERYFVPDSNIGLAWLASTVICYRCPQKKTEEEDDKLITELHEDCMELLGLVSVEDMWQQVSPLYSYDINVLVLKPSCSFALLILSRLVQLLFAVRATLSSLPDEVVDTVGITSLPAEDPVSERTRTLEYLDMQEELIIHHLTFLDYAFLDILYSIT
ncbi:hypothetical protein ARALYDRAFT_904931 [Arabidopsis lyrata subsp. lyrata]|uniref:Uncharacterized protein n=1 Tax=Arabidopsis lyrata subsp. lyrata TaxID=81972 RepID=D7LLX1_ARALL|nr:hypothetical protein ARALYDRAFT_904931 [Arabidopsis lyrata subsp. lyrata]